jgi:endonuclease/exonuclease/phosphatase family metal-dependent hydrolase
VITPLAGRLRLITFNILHDSARSPSGAWPGRRPLVVQAIRSTRADVICLQEVSNRQLPELVSDLEDFEPHAGLLSGRTRFPPLAGFLAPVPRALIGDFVDLGAHCPIFFRRDRFRCVDRGGFQILHAVEGGGTPHGSPHIASWVRLKDHEDGGTLTVYNTHLGWLPWRGASVAGELLDHLDRDHRGELQVLCGDLNSSASGPAMRTLVAARGSAERQFHDAWRIAESRSGRSGTYHLGWGLPGPRFDFVLVRPKPRVLRAEIVLGKVGGRHPSDHAAVLVELSGESAPLTR